MNKDMTYIAVLLDRSGSMRGSETDVIGGLNTFLDQQRKLSGKAIVTIAKHDTQYETIYEDVPLSEARNLTAEDFVPRDGTALADAMNRLMTHVGAKLAAMPEEKRPGNVFFLVFSDGAENSSKEVTLAEVKTMVKHQEEAYAWKFLFFGMDIDAAHGGALLGMRGLGVSKGGGGIARGARAASAYVGYSRLGNVEGAEAIYGSAHVDDKNSVRATEDFSKKLEESEEN